MRIALVLAAAVVFAAAPSAQSAEPAALDGVSIFEQAPPAETAPDLTPAVDLSEWVTPPAVEAPAIADQEIQDSSKRQGAAETVAYWGSLAATTVALVLLADMFM